MSQFESAETAITKDVDAVFATIREEIRSTYFSSSIDDLAYIRDAICTNIPKMVENRNLLLLDTVLNYLTDEARQILDQADNRVINIFYERNQQWKEQLKNEFQYKSGTGTVILSSDLRPIYAAGAGIFGGSVAGILGKALVGGWLPLALGIALGVLVSIVTYQKTLPVVINKIEEDASQYLQQSRTLALQRLREIIATYKNYFARFLQEQNIA